MAAMNVVGIFPRDCAREAMWGRFIYFITKLKIKKRLVSRICDAGGITVAGTDKV
jgi:hypothetical protein